MKIQKISFSIIMIFGMLYIYSCKSGGGEVSQTTGWEYNKRENGGFEVSEAQEQVTGPGLVLIEGGTFTMGRAEQDVMSDWNNIPRRITLPSFYMDMTEVRNVDYREYLFWLGRVFVSYPDVYKKAMPDTLVWRRRLAFNEPYVEYYFRHPSYNEYPIVGINWLQAGDYCEWRTDRVNENILIQMGILAVNPNQIDKDNFNTEAYLLGQYEGVVKKPYKPLGGKTDGRLVRMEDGILLPKYRLPTEAEWEYAAYGLIGNSVDERIFNRRLYPWNGHFLRNDGTVTGHSTRGQMRANFQRGRGDMMGVAGYLNDNAAITAPVTSYWPNDFGLYNMAGNVNEWVLDVYRQTSALDDEDFRPFRGNIFTKMRTESEDGPIVEKDNFGRIPRDTMTAKDNAGRQNYHRSDNRNYLDGDLRSAIATDWNNDNEASGSNRMYFQGKDGKGMTSLVTDESRVYKGGSWRDRAYWMVPANRRFLDQNKSTDDIGFRCAMIRVGSQGGY